MSSLRSFIIAQSTLVALALKIDITISNATSLFEAKACNNVMLLFGKLNLAVVSRFVPD